MGVRCFRNIWFALVAFLWLPALAHCQLESLTGLDFLQCHEETAAAHSSSRDCDTCCTVEKSQFRSVQQRLDAPQPNLLPVFLAAAALMETAQLPPQSLFTLAVTPLDLSPRWQFVFRTALPVRAPSSVS